MTKERKFAIDMWTNIRCMLSASDRLTCQSVLEYKFEFCENHDLSWKNNCWFCQYIPSCNKCPLKDYNTGSLYWTVLLDRKEKNVRIDACTNIIKALEGEEYDDSRW